jgi:hypothetical protein
LVDERFCQRVGLRRRTGENDCGEPLYAPPESAEPEWIWGILSVENTLERTELGEESGLRGLLLTNAPLRPGDAVECDGQRWVMRSVTAVRGLCGEIRHYEGRVAAAAARRFGGVRL